MYDVDDRPYYATGYIALVVAQSCTPAGCSVAMIATSCPTQACRLSRRFGIIKILCGHYCTLIYDEDTIFPPTLFFNPLNKVVVEPYVARSTKCNMFCTHPFPSVPPHK
jgi:hypothetical protein